MATDYAGHMIGFGPRTLIPYVGSCCGSLLYYKRGVTACFDVDFIVTVGPYVGNISFKRVK